MDICFSSVIISLQNVKHVLWSIRAQIRLNVGGQMFVTALTTLMKDPNSMLASMVSGRYSIELDEQGALFLDRYWLGKKYSCLASFYII